MIAPFAASTPGTSEGWRARNSASAALRTLSPKSRTLLPHGVRIFNFQDDNFFLPNPKKAAERFRTAPGQAGREGVKDIAIAVKAGQTVSPRNHRGVGRLGLFRVFLGVENASENGLRNLNRKCRLNRSSTRSRSSTSSTSNRLQPADVRAGYVLDESWSICDSWSGTSKIRSTSAGLRPMPVPGWRQSSRRGPPARRLFRLRLPAQRPSL